MKNVKFNHKTSKRLMSKKEFGLQINLGEQIEERVKNYTILLRQNNKVKKEDYFDEKNRKFSFYSSSSGDYSNDYYDKFLSKLNSIKNTSKKSITPDNKNIQRKLKENSVKIDKKNIMIYQQPNMLPNKKYRTILKQNLYKRKDTKKSLSKENEDKNKNKEDIISARIIKQDNTSINNLKEKITDLKIKTDEIPSYINDKSQKTINFEKIISPLSKKKNTIKDDSNKESENKKTKHFSSIKSKKSPFKQKDNSLSNSLKNHQNYAKIKRQTSLKNENLKEKVKTSLIRKITNSLEETHIKNYLFHPKKIDVENLLKKKKKSNNIDKKEKFKLNDNSFTKIPTPSKKETLIINTKKKNLFCCIPLC